MSPNASNADLSPVKLLVRCLIEEQRGQWQAFTLEFGLAAQADTENEAKAKLEAMIVSYLEDALVGEDRAHAQDLLNRKATWQVFAKYYFYLLTSYLANYITYSKNHTVYRQPMPLAPMHSVA